MADKYNDIGSNISDMVQKAIDSGDFSKLSMAIQDTVSSAVNTAVNSAVNHAVNGMTEGLSSMGDSINRAADSMTGRKPKVDYTPDYMKQKTHEREAAQNPWKGNSVFEQKAEEFMMGKNSSGQGLFSPGNSSRLIGYLQFIVGLAGTFGCVMGLIMIFIAASVAGVGLIPAKVILIILSVLFALLSWKGSSTITRIKKFKNYVKLLRGRTSVSIQELADATGKNAGDTLKEIREMLQNEMFVQGHLDQDSKMLFVTNESYEEYCKNQQQIQKERQEAAAQAEKTRKAQEGLPEEVKKVIEDGNVYIQKIRENNAAIADQTVTEKLNGLEAVTTKIFEYVAAHPESAGETKKLMRYYLPTTVKLLDSYINLSAEMESGQHPEQNSNIVRSKKEIEDTLDTLNIAFARLFDNLYQDTSMDISADISVLNTLLTQEGLTEEEAAQVMSGVN